MKVLWLTNIPSPYRMDFFNELGKHCELTVLFEKKASNERDDLWKLFHVDNFNGVFLKGISIGNDMAFCPSVVKYIKNEIYDKIVVSNVTSPTGMYAAQYMIKHKILYCIEGDGGFAKSGKGMREKLKKHFISNGHILFSTSKMHDEYYLTYDADANKIVRYPFTSLSESYLQCGANFLKEGKARFKKELGFDSNRLVFLFVGQFIHRKGVDILLKAADKLCKEYDNVDFVMIGGCLNDEYQLLANNIPRGRIKCFPFMSSDNLKIYYAASDCFVLPTREDIWGLVINEAMAMGLPIITTNRCIAGLELVDESNGRIIAADNVDELLYALKDFVVNEKDKNSMAEQSFMRIQPYTIENMARVHLEIFKKDLEK